MALPPAISLVLYIVIGFVKPEDTPERDAITEKINSDGNGAAAGATVAAQAGPGDAAVTEGVKD